MKQLRFAAVMEASIRQGLECLMHDSPAELSPILNLVAAFQAKLELLLDQAQHTDVDRGKYPGINAEELIGSDIVWQEAVKDFALIPEKTLVNLTTLWQVYALVEKSCQYYYQATSNTAHPSTRLFLYSLAEIKSILKRRIDSVLRVVYNEIWGKVGFAPFTLGKD